MSTDTIDRTILRLVSERCDILVELGYLGQARLQDAKDHEQAMRVLIKILKTRADVIRNLKSKADNWQKVAIAANRKIKILESRIRNDDNHWSRFV